MAILDPREDWLEVEENRRLRSLIQVLCAQGRLAVPYLVRCIQSRDALVRRLGLDILRHLSLNTWGEQEYEHFLQSDSRWAKPPEQTSLEIVRWWARNRDRLNWDPERYRFRN